MVFDPARFDYLADDAPAPDTVNPSLWRQSQVMRRGGLFKVVDGLYQVRNNDIGDLTIVEGDDGLVIIDCTSSVESARQGMAMFREHVSDKPVAAVIYTHTHIDHYGGVKGVVDVADVASGKVPIIAPGTIASFDKFAIGENVIAGNAMSRRASYAFGSLLDWTRPGSSPAASGSAPSPGPTDLLHLADRPDHRDRHEARHRRADVRVPLRPGHRGAGGDAHLDPAAEGADLRGERQPLAAQHPDPARRPDPGRPQLRPLPRRDPRTLGRRGRGALRPAHLAGLGQRRRSSTFLESQRDTYKYIHDQALRLANKGYTPLEAAEVIELPEELGRKWFNRGYHGTLHHDVRAVYTKELGMWDGDPVSLHPHPPVESAKRYVDFIGAEKILAEGKRAFDAARLPVGRRRSCTSWCSPSPTTRPPATCRPTPTSRWATRSRARSGAASSSPPPRNCARAWCRPHSPPPARTPSWRCRSTSCSTSPPST